MNAKSKDLRVILLGFGLSGTQSLLQVISHLTNQRVSWFNCPFIEDLYQNTICLTIDDRWFVQIFFSRVIDKEETAILNTLNNFTIHSVRNCSTTKETRPRTTCASTWPSRLAQSSPPLSGRLMLVWLEMLDLHQRICRLKPTFNIFTTEVLV